MNEKIKILIYNNKPFWFDILLFVALAALKLLMYLLVTSEPWFEKEDFSDLNLEGFLYVVVLMPFIEELLFRGILSLKTKIYITLLFILALVFALGAGFLTFKNHSAIYLVILCFSTLLIIFCMLMYVKKINTKINGFIFNHLLAFILITSILFGSVHFLNYDVFHLDHLLIITPKILSGIFYAYIVIKYNIFVSVFFHGFTNLIDFVVTYFASINL